MTETREKTSTLISTSRKKASTLSNSSVAIGDELIRHSSIHPNVAQEFIVTTADKMKISLIEHRAALKAQNDWITPLGILLALIPSLIASDFKQFLGLEPSVWKAMFILGSIICFVWLIYAIFISIKLRGKSDIEYVIQQLKEPPDNNGDLK